MTRIGIISKHKSNIEDILNRFILSRGIAGISITPIHLSLPPYPCDILIIEETVKSLNKILEKEPKVIITADELLKLSEPAAIEAYIINCSLNLRSTVTASSIREGSFTYCIQREFSDINDLAHSPQEFDISFGGKAEDIYRYLAAVTALIICGIHGENLTDFTF